MNKQDVVIALVNLANIQISLKRNGMKFDSDVISQIHEKSLKIVKDL